MNSLLCSEEKDNTVHLQMKFSVLLPSRNRLEYLKYAVASVLEQDYTDWEIIISDNCSEDDVGGYVRSLSDSRIQYYRTSTFCPVTDNWNNALEKSIGDYVVMLGDDDSLLKGYFRTCAALIEQYNEPDLIYNSAIQYIYPNVMPGGPEGQLAQHGYASFLVGKESPFILEKTEAIRLAKEILNFNVVVNFNAQHSLVNRSLVQKMQSRGKFYQSPYPDYYATTALLLSATRILAVPYRLVIIGVSPKSFGCYYHNNKEKEGVEFLQNLYDEVIYNKVSKWLFPGTAMNTSWLMAMETVRQNFANDYKLKVHYKKYRFLQVIYGLKKIALNDKLKLRDLLELAKGLFWWEKILYFIPFLIASYICLYPKPSSRAWISTMTYRFSHPTHGVTQVLPGKYKTIFEVFQNVNTAPSPVLEKK